jgi:hypothetical protein
MPAYSFQISGLYFRFHSVHHAKSVYWRTWNDMWLAVLLAVLLVRFENLFDMNLIWHTLQFRYLLESLSHFDQERVFRLLSRAEPQHQLEILSLQLTCPD